VTRIPCCAAGHTCTALVCLPAAAHPVMLCTTGRSPACMLSCTEQQITANKLLGPCEAVCMLMCLAMVEALVACRCSCCHVVNGAYGDV
jgi:hypothetical protein